jgi:hypothetical protein
MNRVTEQQNNIITTGLFGYLVKSYLVVDEGDTC